MEVIDDLISRMNQELKVLAEDNKRLAKALDLPEHKL
jgi:cell shape-determining protein MreC